MELIEKLKILSGAARYDVSCATSGSVRRNAKGQAERMPGICHTWSADGRCVSLLKVLFTNHCIYDCRYCMNRRSNETARAAFTPEELARLASEFYARNYVEGVFLSSGVVKSPDHTMGLLLQVVRLLRYQYAFNGYIHLKLIPGASHTLVDESSRLADRISVNMEFAAPESLSVMAPDKSWDAALSPMNRAADLIDGYARLRQDKAPMPSRFTATGQSTQLIVGATDDSDARILGLADGLYRQQRLKRVYYSAYVPVNADAPQARPPLMREHRLYQADWLLRHYGFGVREIVGTEVGQAPDQNGGMLDLRLDPKCSWALRNLGRFPVEVNRASYEELLRVPGVGVGSAMRIMAARRETRLTPEHLKTLGLTMKRAQYFLTASGRTLAPAFNDPARLRRALLPAEPSTERQFTFLDPVTEREERLMSLTGEM